MTKQKLKLAAVLLATSLCLSGCAVVAVADGAASLVELVGEAAIGTARVAGKAVGAAADAVLPSSK